VETRTDLVTELFGVVGRFRRQLRRSTGRGFDAAGLTESQTELLRLVGRRPGISVREAAAELGLVANTASTLVSKLASEGLLIRTVDAEDRRVGRLRLTEPAQRIARDRVCLHHLRYYGRYFLHQRDVFWSYGKYDGGACSQPDGGRRDRDGRGRHPSAILCWFSNRCDERNLREHLRHEPGVVL